jgi:hypothetical protein
MENNKERLCRKLNEQTKHHENLGNKEANVYQSVYAVWAHTAWNAGFSPESHVSKNIGHIQNITL